MAYSNVKSWVLICFIFTGTQSITGDLNCQPSISDVECKKHFVLEFYQEVFGDKNIDAADKYISAETYIQHNPTIADGLEALKVVLREWFVGALPEKIDVHNISADGDLVWIHTRSLQPITGKLISVVDIYRIMDGKLVEHWDIIQEVPNISANPHPMF